MRKTSAVMVASVRSDQTDLVEIRKLRPFFGRHSAIYGLLAGIRISPVA